MGKTVSAAKAKLVLREGKIRGKPLTAAQKRFFGARAAGLPVKRRAKRKK